MTVRIALAQINPTVGALEKNSKKIIEHISLARKAGAQIVAFPELALSGYPPEDLLLKPSFIRACRAALQEIILASQGIIAVVGYPEEAGDLYNSAAVIADGKLTASYRKHFLPNYGVFDEDRYFLASRDNAAFNASGFKFGVTICEDIWYPTGPHDAQAILGDAELLLNISASPYHRGKGAQRERMLETRAADAASTVAFCNLTGGQDELVFDGGSVVIGPTGDILARAAQFTEELLIADIGDEHLLRHRLSDPRRRKERYALQTAKEPIREIAIPLASRPKSAPKIASRIASPMDELEEIYSALVLGTRDYVVKNGFSKVVLGLSGGIDSSLVACVAADALGAENVTGAALPSRYSSSHSLSDAETLAKNLGIGFITIPIEPAHKAFLEMLKPVFKNGELGVVEENLQSRIRGTTLMALSNKFGWLVLTTGNKSEMSVGYSTLYGDMAGGFAVIKDVPKIMVYDLCRHRNKKKEVIPENVFTKPPSAELRPDQKDTDSLPEYSDLDKILSEYVEQNRSISEIAVNGFSPDMVKKVANLVDRAEYKRRQTPPGVKITPRALGKDWRLPLTNQFIP